MCMKGKIKLSMTPFFSHVLSCPQLVCLLMARPEGSFFHLPRRKGGRLSNLIDGFSAEEN